MDKDLQADIGKLLEAMDVLDVYPSTSDFNERMEWRTQNGH